MPYEPKRWDGTNWIALPNMMRGPVKIEQLDALTLSSTTHPFQIAGEADNPVHMAFDSYRIQARNGAGSHWPLEIQPYGGSLRIGSATNAAYLETRGPFPSGTAQHIYMGGQQVARMFAYGAAHPADFVIQNDATYGKDISIQATSRISLAAAGAERVGIGASDVTIPGLLRLTGQGDVNLTSTTAPLQTGVTNGLNFILDNNECQARNNGAASGFGINANGGLVTIGSGGLHTNGPFTASTAATFTGAVTISEPVNMPIKIVGASGAGYIGFYDGATRRGYCGHYPDNNISLVSDSGTLTVASTGNDTYLGGSSGAGAHTWLRAGSGQIMFMHGGTERGRMADDIFLWGMSTATVQNQGIMLTPGWMSATSNQLNVPAIVCNKVGAGVGGGSDFIHFRFNNTTQGSIARGSGNTATNYNTTSDYRLKDDRGVITGALDRVKQLRPLRAHWKHRPENEVVDGFFAHEVTPVVPEAVTGQKDAVATADAPEEGLVKGQIIPQQLDVSKLVPLLTAGLQEAVARIEALEARA